MILYLDTSALIKKYFKEEGSEDVISLWKQTEAIITSTVAYAETLAAVYRKKREVATINERIFESVRVLFLKDWNSFIHVDVNHNLNKRIEEVLSAYPLRGFDAIHLASALIVSERIPENFIFVCYDKRLLSAAKSEGLEAFPGNLD